MVLVFDIGGVFVKLTGMDEFVGWTGRTPEWVKERWLASAAVRTFESGGSTFDDFATGVIDEFGLPITPSQLLERMQSWMGELYAGAHELLSEISENHSIACLCNQNEVQWPFVRDGHDLGRWFEHHFISHEIGLVKPDEAVFHHVVRELKASPQQISFFDDSLPNVAGARRAGWNAYHVTGTQELRAQLTVLNVL